MNTQTLQRQMYELHDASKPQRIMLAAFGAVWTALAWWLLVGAGLGVLGHFFGRTWQPGDQLRRMFLTIGFSIYYVRVLFTEFVFLKRGIAWSEVFSIAPWLLIIVLLFGIEGGTNRASLGTAGGVGVTLFLGGSWMNSYAEYARHVWKQWPQNQGQLYTQGLFRFSRHPNYLGDLISFTGLCLISRAWVTALVPVLMLAGFVFVNIPVLDSHLHDHYGSAFDDYASRTPKLIPYVY